jgi:MFS family permease
MNPDAVSPQVDETSRRYPGWRVVGTCFVIALFGWGFGFYGHAIYLAELHRQHGWPTSLIAGASTVYYLTGAVLVAFVADAIERLGPRRFVLGGIGCMAVAVALIPIIVSPWQLYVVYLLMALGWAGLGLGSITNLVGLWFRTHRGLAISLALNGASCGGIVLAPLLVWTIAQWGFAAAMLGASAVMVMLLMPLALTFLGTPPAAASAPLSSGAGEGAAALRLNKAQALRDPGFWSVAAPFALALTAQVGFIVHQIAFLDPILGRGGVGWAVAVTTSMAVIGRMGLGAVIDRLHQRRASAVSFVSQALALAAMTQTESTPLLLLACAVFGFSVGNLITFPALIIQREFDAASFGRLIALSTAIGQFTYAFGPGVVGLVRDLAGGYAPALLACAALDIGAAIVILSRRSRPPV